MFQAAVSTKEIPISGIGTLGERIFKVHFQKNNNLLPVFYKHVSLNVFTLFESNLEFEDWVQGNRYQGLCEVAASAFDPFTTSSLLGNLKVNNFRMTFQTVKLGIYLIH